MLQLGFNLMYEFTYFIVSAINDDDGGQTVRLASIVRGVESAGQALSYGINATSWRLDAVAGLNFGLYGLCLLPAWVVVRGVGKGAKEQRQGAEQESGSVTSSK